MIDWLLSKICGDTLPSDDVIRWQFKTFEWLLRFEGGFETFCRDRPPVFPTRKSFPIKNSGGDALAQEVFDIVRRQAHMDFWPCRLVAQERDVVGESMGRVLHGGRGGAAGTFRLDDDGSAIITYSPSLLDNVPELVTTLVHELCHYYLVKASGELPGGPAAEEHATDLTVIFLGFGVFKANCVYSAERTYEGTRYSRKGYLGELPSAYALAIYSELHGLKPAEVRAQLRHNPASYYNGALRDLKKRWGSQLDELRKIQE